MQLKNPGISFFKGASFEGTSLESTSFEGASGVGFSAFSSPILAETGASILKPFFSSSALLEISFNPGGAGFASSGLLARRRAISKENLGVDDLITSSYPNA